MFGHGSIRFISSEVHLEVEVLGRVVIGTSSMFDQVIDGLTITIDFDINSLESGRTST